MEKCIHCHLSMSQSVVFGFVNTYNSQLKPEEKPMGCGQTQDFFQNWVLQEETSPSQAFTQCCSHNHPESWQAPSLATLLHSAMLLAKDFRDKVFPAPSTHSPDYTFKFSHLLTSLASSLGGGSECPGWGGVQTW